MVIRKKTISICPGTGRNSFRLGESDILAKSASLRLHSKNQIKRTASTARTAPTAVTAEKAKSIFTSLQPAHLKVVVDGAHLEDPLAVGGLEVDDLQHHRDGFHTGTDEPTGRRAAEACPHRRPDRHTMPPRNREPVSPMNTLAGIASSRRGSRGRQLPALCDSRLMLAKAHGCENHRDDDEAQCRIHEGHRTAREPVQAIGEIDRVGDSRR